MPTLNEIALAWWRWMGSMLWQVSLLIVIISGLDMLMRRWVWPQVRYALWLLVLVKLIIPPSWSLPSSLVSHTRPQIEQAIVPRLMGSEFFTEMMMRRFAIPSSPSQTTIDDQNLLLNESQQATVSIDSANTKTKAVWQVYALSVWLLGMMVFVGLVIGKMFRLRHWHRQHRENLIPSWFHDLLVRTAEQLNLQRLPAVVFSDHAVTPAVYGMFRPVLLLPANYFDELTEAEAEHVLLHELAHLKRGDLWLHGMCLILQIIYWFNPLIVWVRRQMRHVREMCCDLTVANVLKEETMAYRQTLLNTARKLLTEKVEPGMGLMGVFEESFRIVYRLKWLEKKTWKTHRAAIASAGFIFITMVAFILPMANAKVNPHEGISSSESEQPADYKQTKGIILRQVWTGYTGEGEISPDGRYISVVDWETGDLAILDNTTGDFRRLTNEGSWELIEYAYFSRWSPDGKKLVYNWWSHFSGRDSSEIRIIDVATSQYKTFYKINNNIVRTPVYDWSPDGKFILAVFYTENGKNQTVLISLNSKEFQVILPENSSKPGNLSFSPDGRFILYDFPANDSTVNHDIYIFSLDSKQNLPIVEHPAHDYVLGWTPDANFILFASDRSGSIDCWAVKISDGEVKSEPQLIKANIGPIMSMNFAKDGSFYYGYYQSLRDIFVTQLDQNSGEVLAPPSKFIKKYEGFNGYPQYSPSGKYLVYTSARKNIFHNDPTIICIYNLNLGQEREVHTNLKKVTFPYWSPDENYILFLGLDYQNRRNVYQLDTRTGEMLLILMPDEGYDIGKVRWAHNGKQIYYVLSDKNNSISQIIVYNLDDKSKKEIFRMTSDKIRDLQVSPDGKWLAFINKGEHRAVQVLPVTGGNAQKLFSFEQKGNHYIPVAWGPDGRFIYFTRWPEFEGNWELWRVSLDQKKAQKLDLEFSRFYQMSFHPDGHYLIYEAPGTPRQKAEIWVMENFLPAMITGTID